MACLSNRAIASIDGVGETHVPAGHWNSEVYWHPINPNNLLKSR